MSRKRLLLVIVVLLFVWVTAACQPAGGESADTGDGEALSLSGVNFATSSNDAVDLMVVYSTAEKFWPEVGFTEEPRIIVTDDILPALVSEEVWIIQGGTSQIWAAMAEGSLDLVMVGIDKDNEVRILGSRPGITSVEMVEPGMTASGGDIGDYDELVLREILTELGLNTDELDIVAMGGGADARMQAMLANQLDLGIQQPRNIGPLTARVGRSFMRNRPKFPRKVGLCAAKHGTTTVMPFAPLFAAESWASSGRPKARTRGPTLKKLPRLCVVMTLTLVRTS